jgi:hypothetical protein
MIHHLYRAKNIPLSFLENQPLNEPLSLDTNENFPLLHADIFDASANCVQLGDFNIHHHIWRRPKVRMHHVSQLLISFQMLPNHVLLLPREIITLKSHGGESKIDDVSSSSDLMNTLTACCLRDDLDHESDYKSIQTSFLFSPHASSHVLKPL